jgi:hypothetical protein
VAIVSHHPIKGTKIRTWVSNADSNIPSLELGLVESQSLLQSFQGSEFCITESLRLHLQLVFNDSDICTFTTGKEICDISNSGIEREISEMDGIGWLVWKRELLADGVA